MTSADFFSTFNSDDFCLQHFKELRESQGINCSNCRCTRQRWIEKRQSWECYKCGHRTGIKSGTIMTHSKLSIKTWYHALFCIAMNKKSMSVKELQRQMGMKRYEPVWYLRKKVQFAFRQQNQRHLNRGFFSIEQMMQSLFAIRSVSKKQSGETSPRKRSQVLLIPEGIESIRKRGHAELVLLIATGMPLTTFERSIIENSRYRTRFCYKRLTRFGGYHYKEQDVLEIPSAGWAAKVMYNSRRVLSGIHHLIQDKYLQFALDEFAFKYNCRGKPDIFLEALMSAVKGRW